jgi:23S rRNA (pseudouridine1915-N3)-methyltransferase
MVRIKVILVGKTKEPWIKEGISHYEKLLRKYVQLELIEVKEERISTSREKQSVLAAEAEKILKHLMKSSLPICLDVKGESLSSEAFAQRLEENLNRGYNDFTFILGGPLGLSQKLCESCTIKLSLSEMTFTHEMSRVILLEQIYRAFSILKGTGYHK